MESLNEKVGNRIKKLRNDLKISREKLSEMAEISDRFIYDIENGIKGLSADNLLSVSNALGVTSDYLLTGVTNNGDFSTINELLLKLKDEDLQNIEEIIRIFVFAVTSKY